MFWVVLTMEQARERPGLRALMPWGSLPVALIVNAALWAWQVPYILWFSRQRAELEARVFSVRTDLDLGLQLTVEDGPFEGYGLRAIEGGYVLERTRDLSESDWVGEGLLWLPQGLPREPDAAVGVRPLASGWYSWSGFQVLEFSWAPSTIRTPLGSVPNSMAGCGEPGHPAEWRRRSWSGEAQQSSPRNGMRERVRIPSSETRSMPSSSVSCTASSFGKRAFR